MPLQKKIIIGSIAALSLILLIIIFVYIGISIYTSGLKVPIEKQLAAIRIEDPATAYSYTTTNFQKITTFEDFKKFISQYSGLSNNEGISYNSRKIDNGVGTVDANLVARSGVKTPVLYKLKMEHNEWRIESIVINPSENLHSSNASSKPLPAEARLIGLSSTPPGNTANAANAAPVTAATPPSEVVLKNEYKNSKFKYLIRYPADWKVTDDGKSMVTFRGKEGTASAPTTFLIQSFRQTGKKLSAQQLIDLVKKEIAKKATDISTVDEGEMPPINNKVNFEGRFAVYSYKVDNQPIGHLEVVTRSTKNSTTFIFDYITSAAQFQTDLPIIKAMIISFSIIQ